MASINDISATVQIACRQLDVYCEETLGAIRNTVSDELAAARAKLEAVTRENIAILERASASRGPADSVTESSRSSSVYSENELQTRLEYFADRAWDLMSSEIFPLIESRSRALFEEEERKYRDRLVGVTESARTDLKTMKQKFKRVVTGTSDFLCASQRSLSESRTGASMATLVSLRHGAAAPHSGSLSSIDSAIRAIALRATVESVITAFEGGQADTELATVALGAWESTVTDVSETDTPVPEITEQLARLTDVLLSILDPRDYS
jgi:hypothetical protein